MSDVKLVEYTFIMLVWPIKRYIQSKVWPLPNMSNSKGDP